MSQDFCAEPPKCLIGFLGISSNFFVDISITRYCTAQVFKKVKVFQLCAINGDAQLSRDTVWSKVEEDLHLPQAECKAKHLGCFDKSVDDCLEMAFMIGHESTFISKQCFSNKPLQHFLLFAVRHHRSNSKPSR